MRYLYSCLATHAENELIYQIFILFWISNQQPLSLEAQGPLPMTLPGYCLHIMKLPGKEGGWGGVNNHRLPLYRKQSKPSGVIAKDVLV